MHPRTIYKLDSRTVFCTEPTYVHYHKKEWRFDLENLQNYFFPPDFHIANFFYITHNNVCWLRLSRPHPYFLGCYVICSIICLFQGPESRAWYFGAQWPPESHLECSSSNLRNWNFCSQKECILNSCIKLKQLEVKFIFVVMGIKLRFLWWTNAISMTPIYRPQRVLVSGCLLYLLYSFFKVLSL